MLGDSCTMDEAHLQNMVSTYFGEVPNQSFPQQTVADTSISFIEGLFPGTQLVPYQQDDGSVLFYDPSDVLVAVQDVDGCVIARIDGAIQVFTAAEVDIIVVYETPVAEVEIPTDQVSADHVVVESRYLSGDYSAFYNEAEGVCEELPSEGQMSRYEEEIQCNPALQSSCPDEHAVYDQTRRRFSETPLVSNEQQSVARSEGMDAPAVGPNPGDSLPEVVPATTVGSIGGDKGPADSDNNQVAGEPAGDEELTAKVIGGGEAIVPAGVSVYAIEGTLQVLPSGLPPDGMSEPGLQSGFSGFEVLTGLIDTAHESPVYPGSSHESIAMAGGDDNRYDRGVALLNGDETLGLIYEGTLFLVPPENEKVTLVQDECPTGPPDNSYPWLSTDAISAASYIFTDPTQIHAQGRMASDEGGVGNILPGVVVFVPIEENPLGIAEAQKGLGGAPNMPISSSIVGSERIAERREQLIVDASQSRGDSGDDRGDEQHEQERQQGFCEAPPDDDVPEDDSLFTTPLG